jgi:N-acetylglucosaminyldiphosphoundecaprenol N-acetyl-beta-D-mannosaminyltransferase
MINLDDMEQINIGRKTGLVLSVLIDAKTWGETLTCLLAWARSRESRYVCICNVHSVVTATQDAEFCRVLNEADMSTPDGAPVAWMLRRLGHVDQQRINGPDLMWRYCEYLQLSEDSIFLFGSTPETLNSLRLKLTKEFPSLKIAGSISPPFRLLIPEEDEAIVEQINASGAGVVFVSLGCPKQEFWMSSHRGRINAVMLGVGAAFDYHAGTVRRAPIWMQNYGLEWLFRLISEPRRLWKRYFLTNTLFIFFTIKQILGFK